jgi:Sulfatase.
MRRNLEVAEDARGHYSTDLFTDEAVTIINNHDTTNSSLFLYLSHLAPHAGNYENPLQAPEDSIRRFAYIRDHGRRTYAGITPIRTIVYSASALLRFAFKSVSS